MFNQSPPKPPTITWRVLTTKMLESLSICMGNSSSLSRIRWHLLTSPLEASVPRWFTTSFEKKSHCKAGHFQLLLLDDVKIHAPQITVYDSKNLPIRWWLFSKYTTCAPGVRWVMMMPFSLQLLPKHKYRINLGLSHVCVLPWGALHPNKDNRKIVNTLPETNIAPDKWMVGRLVSFRDGLFSGSMLVFGRATQLKQSLVDFPASLAPISRFEHRPSQTNLMTETHESMDRKLFSVYVPKTADLE